MAWKGLSLRSKSVAVLILMQASLPVVCITIIINVFADTVPAFVYAIPAIWVLVFLVTLARPWWGLIGGIAWSILSIVISIIPPLPS